MPFLLHDCDTTFQVATVRNVVAVGCRLPLGGSGTGLFYLVMEEYDGYVALALIPKRATRNLTEVKLDLTARKIFDKLADRYELSVRTSAWTTAKYQKR